MNTKNFRPGQREAFNVCLKRIMDGESTTSIVLPTRYGKSDLMRSVALALKQQGIISGTIALSPGLILRDQLVSTKSLLGMAQRYQIDAFDAMRVRVMRDAFELSPFANDEYLLSCTIELAVRRIDRFMDIADTMLYQTGKPLLIFIDECHESSEEKKRGELVAKLLNKGALFILVTATPIRADGEIIPGFRKKILDEKDARRFVVTDAGDGVHNRIDVYEGKKELVVLDADHITTFKDAWNEDPSALCHLSREIVDVDIAEIDNEESEQSIKLSDVPISKSRRYLSKAIRNDRVIEKAIELFLDQLERIKRVNPKCAGIIFTGNDEPADAQDNAHAKKVKIIIGSIEARYGLNLDVKIATMKSDDDEKAAKTIQQFVGNDSDNGRGDVLIVKQMGGRGLDAPRVKVVLDLSSVRTVASVVQRLMRCATPYNGIHVATVITLSDPLMAAIWQQQVADEGGERSGEWHDSGMEMADSYLKLKEDNEQKDYRILSADLSMYDDSHGYLGDMALRALVEQVCNALPIVNAHYTKPEIQRRLHETDSLRRVVGVESITGEIEKIRSDIVTTIKELAGHYYGPNDPAYPKWVDRNRWFMNHVKKIVGIDPAIELKHITCLKTLRKALDVVHNLKTNDCPL